MLFVKRCFSRFYYHKGKPPLPLERPRKAEASLKILKEKARANP